MSCNSIIIHSNNIQGMKKRHTFWKIWISLWVSSTKTWEQKLVCHPITAKVAIKYCPFWEGFKYMNNKNKTTTFNCSVCYVEWRPKGFSKQHKKIFLFVSARFRLNDFLPLSGNSAIKFHSTEQEKMLLNQFKSEIHPAKNPL